MPQNSKQTVLEFGYRVFCLEKDVQKQLQLAQAWATYEAAMNVYPAQAPMTSFGGHEALIARYKVQSHYLWHRCFASPNILAQAQRLSEIELTLVHGDLDALCPFENSHDIQRAVPQANLIRVSGGGHDLTDSGMLSATFHALTSWR